MMGSVVLLTAPLSQQSFLDRPASNRLVTSLVGTSAARSELTTMTYQSDARRDKQEDRFYISWIIRGGIVLAIVIAALAFTSTNYPDRDVPQIATTVPAPAS